MVTAIVSSDINCLITSYPQGLFLGRAPNPHARGAQAEPQDSCAPALVRGGTSRCAPCRREDPGAGADSSRAALSSSLSLSLRLPPFLSLLLLAFALLLPSPDSSPLPPPLPGLPPRPSRPRPTRPPAHLLGTQLRAPRASLPRPFPPGAAAFQSGRVGGVGQAR